jgi:glycosyltransferase involved in cell wall biosynthesis
LINNPKITIVTPVFNCVEYIEDTILSVLNQTYKNIEYIVVDGGSNDGTHKILQKYSNKINFLIKEKDYGMYHALNKGFKIATGKYLSWINADDLYFKNAIKDSISFMEKNKIQWIVGKSCSIKLNKITLRDPYHFPNIIIRNGLSVPCFWGYIPQESVIFSKDLYVKSGQINKNFKYAGDFDLWKRFAKYERLNSVRINIGIFRKRKGQISENQRLYLREINKIHCIIPFGKIIRLIFSFFANLKNYYEKK